MGSWIAIVGAVVFTLAYFWVRREWVFRERLRLLLGNEDLDHMPEFNDMLFRWWWVWSMEELKHKGVRG